MKLRPLTIHLLAAVIAAVSAVGPVRAMATAHDSIDAAGATVVNAAQALPRVTIDMPPVTLRHSDSVNIYELPYSLTLNVPDWRRLWINSAVYAAAFSGTLAVLECLPEDATAWNRESIQGTPPLKRWYRNVFKLGPEWDHDKPIFNYILHPYAGAVYFMAARSAGFNFWRSLLYSTIISDIGWEFGIEAFMERPSYQDIFITPIVGSVIGEGFYRLKRHISANGYRLFGSPVLGNIVAVLIDPVNEVVGLFDGNDARRAGRRKRRLQSSGLVPTVVGGCPGVSLALTF